MPKAWDNFLVSYRVNLIVSGIGGGGDEVVDRTVGICSDYLYDIWGV